MIRTDDDLRVAHECIEKIERILLESRRKLSPKQYGLMSKPFLIDLQQRHAEILAYLMEAEIPAGTP